MKFDADILPLCQANIEYFAPEICKRESIGKVTQAGLFFNETEAKCLPAKLLQCNTILYAEFCSEPKKDGGLQIWAIVVIVIVVVIGLWLIISRLCIWFHYSRMRRHWPTAASSATESENVSSSDVSEMKTFPSQKTESLEVIDSLADTDAKITAMCNRLTANRIVEMST
eukprot:m.233989 g.233989  ORF g.233989 m.233989 type:complete len:170 (+) comp40101_c0_seq15:581-1090(+)